MSNYKDIIEHNKQMVQRLVKYSGLKENLVQNIVKFSKCLCKVGSDSIGSDIFSVVLSTYFNIFDQTALIKCYNRKSRRRADGQMSIEEFAHILCAFLTSDLDLKIDYVFEIYDVNGDGMIDMHEVSSFIRACKCVSDTDESEKDETYHDLSTFAASKLGIVGHDGIDLEHFRKKVKENSLVLSILGEALPNATYVEKFRQTITGKSNLEMIKMFGNIRFQLLREIPDSTEPKYYPIVLDLP